MVIYLDMDNVLTAFDDYVSKIIGKPISKFNKSKDGWDALGDYKDTLYLLLNPTKDASQLVRGVISLANEHSYTVSILTALPKVGNVPLAEKHKRLWLSKYFPDLCAGFKIGPHAVDKQNHCTSGDILIDDSSMNISQWGVRGGFGILHTSAEKSLLDLSNHLNGCQFRET